MARRIATATRVELPELLDFARDRHRGVLMTTRSDGSVQASPVACGVDPRGRFVVSTYPTRAKAVNARRTGTASLVVLSDDWDGPWVQVDGEAEVLDMPAAEDAFVDYYRCIAGEHPDWDEYRAAMRLQNKSLIRLTPTRWGPLATGGFPPEHA